MLPVRCREKRKHYFFSVNAQISQLKYNQEEMSERPKLQGISQNNQAIIFKYWKLKNTQSTMEQNAALGSELYSLT